MSLKHILLLITTIFLSSNVYAASKYIVKKGDNLYDLSKKFNIPVSELKKTNGLKSNKLFIGDVILIPEFKSYSKEAIIDYTSSREYRVIKGDSLIKIANKYGVKVKDLKNINELKNNNIKIGQILIIPSINRNSDIGKGTQTDGFISKSIQENKLPKIDNIKYHQPLKYVVTKGDTVGRISNDFGISLQELKNVNGLTSNKLKKGMVLRIPSTGTDGIVRRELLTKPRIKYIVKEGDTIEELQKKFGISFESLKSSRNLADYNINEGDILVFSDSKYEKEFFSNSVYSDSTRDLNRNVNTEYHNPITLPKPDEVSAKTNDKTTNVYHQNDSDYSNFKESQIDGKKQKESFEEHVNAFKDQIINIAKEFLGVPYKFGGNSFRTGIDCSAYVRKVFEFLDIDLPRTARDIYQVGIYVDKSQLDIGDLVFFRTYAKYPSHVGIYIGNDKFIHASSKSRKVTIDDLNLNYYQKRYIGAKRVEYVGLFYDELSKGYKGFEAN